MQYAYTCRTITCFSAVCATCQLRPSWSACRHFCTHLLANERPAPFTCNMLHAVNVLTLQRGPELLTRRKVAEPELANPTCYKGAIQLVPELSVSCRISSALQNRPWRRWKWQCKGPVSPSLLFVCAQVPCVPQVTACSNVAVPTTSPNGSWAYGRVGGALALSATDMTVQPDAWQKLNTYTQKMFCDSKAVSVTYLKFATHICSYLCQTARYTGE